MMIKLDLSIADPTIIQNNLEKPCCDGKLTHECQTHFLTAGLKAQLRDSVKADTNGTTAKIIAELGKYDSCREFLLDESIISFLVNNLRGKNNELLTQSCRALANLCYDLVSAQNMIIAKGGLDEVSSLLSRPTGDSDCDKQLLAAAIGFLLNLVTENPDCHSKVMAGEVPALLLNFARAEVDARDVTSLSQHVILILVTLAESTPMDQVFTLPVCKVAIELLGVCRGPAFYIPALQFLVETTVPDIVKLRLVEAGLCDLLMAQLEDHPKLASEEEKAKFELIGQVIANVLTGDEAMEYAYNAEQPALLERLADWLSMEEYNLVYSSALCVGNVARTDAHSREIVSRGMHKLVMQALQRDTCDMKMQHALLSTLRNLAIPKENKKRLVADGVLEVLRPMTVLDIRAAAPVIFKLVGAWRQLADGEPAVALKLGADVQMMEHLVTWSDTAMCPWVSSEALRLLCSLVTKSRERSVVENLLRAKAIPELTKLLTSQHGVMQMEAVNALAVGGALLIGVPCAWETTLLDAALGEKIKLLLQTPDLSPQLLENVCTMLDTLVRFDKIRYHLREVELLDTLKSTVDRRQDFSHLLPRIANLANLI